MLGSVVAVVLVALIGSGLGVYHVWATNERSFVATVNGERVSAGEMRLNLLMLQQQYTEQFGWDVWGMQMAEGLTVEDFVKEEAYSMAVSNTVAVLMAREHGADVLTPEQEEIIQNDVDSLYLWGDDFIDYIGLSDDELVQAFRNRHYAENLFTMITDELFVLDEEALDAEFAQVFSENKALMTHFSFYHIYTIDHEVILQAQQALADGVDFMEVMAQFSEHYYPTPELPEMDFDMDYEALISDIDDADDADEVADEAGGDDNGDEDGDGMQGEIIFDHDFGPEIDFVWDMSETVMDMNIMNVHGHELMEDMFIVDALMAMEIGDISDIIPLWVDPDHTFADGYIIIYLYDVEEPDYEWERMRFVDEFFIPNAKTELFQPIFAGWADEKDIRRNDRGFNAIRLFGF